MFKDIAPELFDKELVKSTSNSDDNKWSPAPLMGVLPRNDLDPSADDLFKELGVPVSTTLGATSWTGVMDRRPRLMWEHEGQCQCGKKTYLAGQCRKCALEDAAERHDHVERQAAQDADAAIGDYEILVPSPGSLPKENAASEPDNVAAWLETV